MIGIGQVVSGKYRLLRLLGDGGMGSVYEAQHEVLGTRVAIKVLHADLARRGGLIERFLQEARVAAQIRSPHVVQVTDVDRTPEGNAYIVMELLQGEPLSTVLERDRKLPIPTAVDYTRQILEALEAAHALGVTHRDLKPENVFVTFVAGKPVIKLIDFGIAKLRSTDPAAKNLTVAGVVMGTAEYMAPEQAASADKADARSDIYAVGVMLYEMIAGVRPVEGDDARIIAAKVERGDVKPLVHVAPQVPRELAGLVHRAMASRPDLRFPTATEMRVALERASLTADGARKTTRPLSAVEGIAPATDKTPPPAMELGPSTVLGAPVESVFLPPGQTGHAAAGHTAAPALDAPTPGLGGGYGPAPGPPPTPMPPPPVAAPAPYYERAPQLRKRGNLAWLWLVLPLLLGAGVVVVVIVNEQSGGGSGGGGTTTSTAATTTTVDTTATGATTATATQTAGGTDTVEPLTGGSHVPTRPTTRPTTGGGAKPPASGSAGGTKPPGSASGAGSSTSTAPFPTIPPLPSGFPIPSGFPSAFPTALPSAFPFPPPVPPAGSGGP